MISKTASPEPSSPPASSTPVQTAAEARDVPPSSNGISNSSSGTATGETTAPGEASGTENVSSSNVEEEAWITDELKVCIKKNFEILVPDGQGVILGLF